MANSSRSPLLPIFLIVMVDVLGFTLMIPLLPFYAEEFGASPVVVGILLASYALFQLVSGPILGRISDQVGRKPTLLLSQIGTLIGFLVLGFAGALWMLFLGRIIDGITAGNLSIAQAYISDVTKPEERTRAFGLIGIAFGVGFLFGPAMSGFLSKFGHQWPAFAAAALSLTAILCTVVLLPNIPVTKHQGLRPGRIKQFTQYFERPLSRRRLLEYFMFLLSFSMVTGGLALYLQARFGYGAEETGYIYAYSGLVGAIVQGGLLGMLAKRIGERKIALIGFLSMGITYVLLGWAYSLVMLLVLITVGGFGGAITRPALTTLLTESAERHEQGAIIGVGQSLASIAMVIGPIVAGWLIEHNQLEIYAITAGAAALTGVLFRLMPEPEAPLPETPLNSGRSV